jgi:hypothetical protein
LGTSALLIHEMHMPASIIRQAYAFHESNFRTLSQGFAF